MRHHIILAADQAYIPHMATAIRSLVETNSDLAFTVHVINSDIDAAQWQRLQQTVAGFDCQLVDAKVDSARLDGLVTGHHFTRANYYRLLAAEMVPAESALYLDADLIVIRSIRELLTAAPDGHAVAAVADPGVTPHPGLGMTAGAGYFNSGVMRLDLARWRALDLGMAVVDLVRTRPDAIRYVDQCGLNGVLNGAWTALDPTWNLQSSLYDLAAADADRVFGTGRLAAAVAQPHIVHFSGNSKPWHLNNRHPHKALYWHYRRRTAFARWLPDDIGPRTLARRLLPAGLLRALGRG